MERPSRAVTTRRHRRRFCVVAMDLDATVKRAAADHVLVLCTHHVVAVWDTGIGATALPVARLNPATNETVGLHLARALTRMSEAVWLSYVRPEICDRPVADALKAMRRPHLPEAGLLRVEPHPGAGERAPRRAGAA